MIGQWTNWKPFPDAYHGGHLDAPIGPGVYEVWHIVTGEQVAFGYSNNVAQSLSGVVKPQPARGWPFFRRAARRYLSSEMEYRTCATGTLAEAKVTAEQMRGQRQAMFRRFSPGMGA